MYEGEVFTYRTDRMTRPPARQRTPLPDTGRAEALAAAERMARLESTVLRLEENLTHLTGVVAQLSSALDEMETARIQATPAAPAPVAPKVSVQLLPAEPSEPPPADVKVSFFAGNSTEAILGQVRVTQQ